MKKWKFNLESVREHRHRLEEMMALQVTAALRKLTEANERVQQLRAEMLVSTLNFFPRERSTPELLLQLSDFHRALQVKLADAIVREQAAENILQQARDAWQRTRLEKEAIDKLFERRKCEHQTLLEAEEQKLLDSFGKPQHAAFGL
jgi:flagellar export protein FliJ